MYKELICSLEMQQEGETNNAGKPPWRRWCLNWIVENKLHRKDQKGEEYSKQKGKYMQRQKTKKQKKKVWNDLRTKLKLCIEKVWSEVTQIQAWG